MKGVIMDWHEWRARVFKLLQSHYEGLEFTGQVDWVAWKEFYDDGYTPDDAVTEDLSN